MGSGSIEVQGSRFHLRAAAVALTDILLTRPLELSDSIVDQSERPLEGFLPVRGHVILTFADTVKEWRKSSPKPSVLQILRTAGITFRAKLSPVFESTNTGLVSKPSSTVANLLEAEDPFKVIDGSGVARRPGIFVIPTSSCERELYNSLVYLHTVKKRAFPSLEASYHHLLKSTSGRARGQELYATVDGSKNLSRIILGSVDSGEKEVEVVVLEPKDDNKVSVAVAYALSFKLNRLAENREQVSPVQILRAAALATSFSFAESTAPVANAKCPRFVDEENCADTLAALMKRSFVESVFHSAGHTDIPVRQRHALSPFPPSLASAAEPACAQYVKAALSAVGTMDLDKVSPEAIRSFKSELRRASPDNPSPDVERAVEALWEMDGAASVPDTQDSTGQTRRGSAMTRTEVNGNLLMAAAFAHKPASQALLDFAHRFHPQAARVAFSRHVLISRNCRGIAKDKAGDYETFLIMSIVLNIALRLERCTACAQDSKLPEQSLSRLFVTEWGTQASAIASVLSILTREFDRLTNTCQEIEDINQSGNRNLWDHTRLGNLQGRRDKILAVIREKMIALITRTRKLDDAVGSRIDSQCGTYEEEVIDEEGLTATVASLVAPDAVRGDACTDHILRPSETHSTNPAIGFWWTVLWEQFQVRPDKGQGFALSDAVRVLCCGQGTGHNLLDQVVGNFREMSAPSQQLQACPDTAQIEGASHESADTGAAADPATNVSPAPTIEEVDATAEKSSTDPVVEVEATAKKSSTDPVVEVDATAKKSSTDPVVEVDATAIASDVRASTVPAKTGNDYQLRRRPHKSSVPGLQMELVNSRRRKNARRRPSRKRGHAALDDDTLSVKKRVFNEAEPSRKRQHQALDYYALTEADFGRQMAVLFRLGAPEEETAEGGKSLQSWHRKALLDCLTSLKSSCFVANAIPLPEGATEGAPSLDSFASRARATESQCSIDPGDEFRKRVLQFASLPLAAVHVLLHKPLDAQSVALFREVEVPVKDDSFCCGKCQERFFNKIGSQAGRRIRLRLVSDGVYATGISSCGDEADTAASNEEVMHLTVKLLQPPWPSSNPSLLPVVFETTREYTQLCDHVAGSVEFLEEYFSTYLSCTVLGRDGVLGAAKRVGEEEALSEAAMKAILSDGGAIARHGRMRVALPKHNLVANPTFDVEEFLFGERGLPGVWTMSSAQVGDDEAGVMSVQEDHREDRLAVSATLMANLCQDVDGEPIHTVSVGSVSTMGLIRLLIRQEKYKTMAVPSPNGMHRDSVRGAFEAVMKEFGFSEKDKNLVRSFDKIAGGESVTLFPGQLALVSELVPQVPGQSSAPTTPGTSEDTADAPKLRRLQLESISRFTYLTPVFVSSASFALPQ